MIEPKKSPVLSDGEEIVYLEKEAPVPPAEQDPREAAYNRRRDAGHAQEGRMTVLRVSED
jgi:hypothetical protein